jgi:hypothetical protein
MHSFTFNYLPPSFLGMWSKNIDRDPTYNLRNADNYYIPPAKFTTLKRLPLFTFPLLWNTELHSKEEMNSKTYLRSLKSRLLQDI